MELLLWVLLGLLAGWLASVVMQTQETQGTVMDIMLGIVGAFVGGVVMNILGLSGPGLNLYSILIATFGAIALILIGRRFRYS